MANRFLNNISINDQYTLPASDGNANQVLATNGSGQLSFVDQSGGASLSGGAANKLAIWSGTDALTNDTNLHWDTSNDRLGIGTANPNYALHVNGQIYSESSTYPVYYLKRNTSATGGSFNTTSGIASAFKLETDSSGTITDGFGGGIVFSLGDTSPNTAARIYARRDGGDQTGALQFWGGADGNTALMTMRAGGNIGIGTTSPGAKLDVSGNIRLGQYNVLEWGSNSSNRLAIQNALSGATFTVQGSGDIELNPQNGGIKFKASGTTSAVLTSSGDFGIGTSSPSAYLEIETSGSSGSDDIAIFSRSTGEVLKISREASEAVLNASSNLTLSADYDNNTTSTGSNVIFKTDATERMRIDSSGDVGIGTNNPSEKLHVSGGKFLVSSSAYTEMAVDQTDSGKVKIGISSGTAEGFFMVRNDEAGHVSSAPEFKILLNDSEKLRLDSTGLGLGTNSPDSLLHLKSTGDVKLILEADSDNSGENDNPLIELKQDNSGIIGRLGMVGDAGQLFTNSRTNSTGLGTVYQQDLIFFTENSARVYIKGESGYQGRVGIGTATPSHELHITGTGLASSSFRAPIFYDSDNTDYYVNPSASGVSLHINGIIDQDFAVSNLNSAWTAPGTNRDQGFIFGRYSGSATNKPDHNDNANWFANIYSHASGGTASYGIQLAGANAGSGENALQLRNVSNGSFSAWRKVFHEGHPPTAAEVGAAASSHNQAWSTITSTPTTLSGYGITDAAASSHTHAASDITSGTFATARIPSLDASKITSGTFSDLFANSTRYNFGLIDGNSSQTRDKLRVWNSSSYTIGMKSGFTFGHLNDYAMSFQMNNDNDRGWWWGDDAHTDAQGAMSLTTNGRLTVATSLSIGQGESITSASTVPLFVDGFAVFDTTSGTEPVCITRSGSTSQEVLKIGVTDTVATFNYIEDTSSEGTNNFGTYQFQLGGNNGESTTTAFLIGQNGIQAEQFYDYNNTNFRVNPSTGPNLVLSGSSYIRAYHPSWTTTTTHDIFYGGWTSGTGDYIYVKAPGNSATDFGTMLMADNVFAVGRDNSSTGGVSSSSTAPLDSTWAYIKSTGVYAPTFYDSNNTNYYVNPSSSSKLYQLSMFGHSINSGQVMLVPDKTTYSSGAGFTNMTYRKLNVSLSYTPETVVSFQAGTTQKGSIGMNAYGTQFNTSGSDERLKENFETWDENVLNSFETIQPKKFNFKSEPENSQKTKGYIAQEMVDKFPEAYPLMANEDGENRYMFNPSGMTVYLMKAVKELIEENKQLKQRVEVLENQ